MNTNIYKYMNTNIYKYLTLKIKNNMKKIFFFISLSCKKNENEIERITKNHKIENPEEIKNIPEKISKNITITEQEECDLSKINEEDLAKIPKNIIKEYCKNIFQKNKTTDNIQEYFKKLFIDQNQGKDDGRKLFEILSAYIPEGIENKLKIIYPNDSYKKTEIHNQNILKLLNVLQDTKYPLKKIYEKTPINANSEKCQRIENFIEYAKKNKLIIYIYKNKGKIEIIFLENAIESYHYYNIDFLPNELSDFLFIEKNSWIKNGETTDIGNNTEVENLYERDYKTLVKNKSDIILSGFVLEGSKIIISKNNPYEFRNFFVHKLDYNSIETIYKNFENGNCEIVYSRNLA
jgi:hypothetical protein